MSPIHRILLTGCGAPGAPGIIRCLRSDPSIRLFVADARPHPSGRYLADDFIQIPTASSPNFSDSIVSIVEKYSIDLVLPLVTAELPHLSKLSFQQKIHPCKVLLSSHDTIALSNDKWATYNHLSTISLPHPKSYIVSTVNELSRSVKSLGYPDVPVVIKPTVSNGMRGVRILDPSIDRFDLLFNHKPSSVYSTLEELTGILSSRSFPTLLVSEYLPGDECTVDAVVFDGITKIQIIRSRERMVQGISTAGTFFSDDRINSYCSTILSSLDFSGCIGLQLKRDRFGEYQLLEINPRLQGTTVSCLGLGINLPLLSVHTALGLNPVYPSGHPADVSFQRIYDELYYTK